MNDPHILDSVEAARERVSRLGCASYPDQPIVATNGNFDLLHYGHVHLLRFCRQRVGGYLFVAVDDDEQVREQKGALRPIFPLKERLASLAAIRYVDFVFPFHGDVAEVYAILRPDIIVKGREWKGNVAGAKYARRVIYAPNYPRRQKLSSADIIQRLLKENR
jgi:cytidyltransferase-like protein